jgi:hypothetical protein
MVIMTVPEGIHFPVSLFYRDRASIPARRDQPDFPENVHIGSGAIQVVISASHGLLNSTRLQSTHASCELLNSRA